MRRYNSKRDISHSCRVIRAGQSSNWSCSSSCVYHRGEDQPEGWLEEVYSNAFNLSMVSQKQKTCSFQPNAALSLFSPASSLILRQLACGRLILPRPSTASCAATHGLLLSGGIPAIPPLVCSSRWCTLLWLVVHRHASLIDLLHLLLDVRSIFDVLLEATDVAVDGMPGFKAERYDGHEAEGEPFPVSRVYQ